MSDGYKISIKTLIKAYEEKKPLNRDEVQEDFKKFIGDLNVPSGTTTNTNTSGTKPNKKYVFAIGAGGDVLSEKYDVRELKWEAVQGRTPYPPDLQGFGVAIVEEKIYMIGGHDDDTNVMVATMYVYDIVNKTWATGPNLPEELGYFGTAVIEKKIYVVGGENNAGDTRAEILEFDTTTNNWRILIAELNLPFPLKDLGLVAIDKTLYAIGGSNATLAVQDIVQSLDLSSGVRYLDAVAAVAALTAPSVAGSRWVPKDLLPEERNDFGVAVHENKIYVAGGSNDTLAVQDTLYVYDSKKNNWETKDALPQPLCCPAMVAGGEYLYLVGGSTDCTYDTAVRTMYKYNIKTPGWKTDKEMVAKRNLFGVVYYEEK
jgi:N-acetylneuraminic acid mutarotase